MGAPYHSIEIERVGLESLRAVLRFCLTLHGQSAADIEHRVGAFLDYSRSMSIDLSRLWLASRNGRTVAGAACIVSPGKTAMLVLPSSAMAGVDAGVIRLLAESIGRAVFDEGVRLIQGLLDESDVESLRALKGCGFYEIAVLKYLERLVEPLPPPEPSVPPGFDEASFHWMTYSMKTHVVFERTILDTYAGSLDCPGLSELRDIGDVIAGHKSAGVFEPENWRILLVGDTPAACSLLARNPLSPSLDVVYMAVCPAFRRRRLGSYLLFSALRQAHRQNCRMVTLAVDQRNTPGCRLYDRFGFREKARRRAMICVRSDSYSD